MNNPVLVEVTRGNMVESLHRGRVAIVDAKGRLVAGCGDIEAPVYPRSAIKPIQAIQLVESGAADGFGLTARELSLACASHNGEPDHVEAVAGWLARIGLDQTALSCGVQWPMNDTAARVLARRGMEPGQLHNNCSGKHTGFLTTARHLGEATDGYIDASHPTQRRWRADLEALAGVNLSHACHGIDRLWHPGDCLAAEGAGPCVRPSGRQYGTGKVTGRRHCQIARRSRGRTFHDCWHRAVGAPTLPATLGQTVLAKVGAEGVYAAAVGNLGYGVAIKIDDGTTRAAETALLAVLDHLGVIDDRQRAALGEWMTRPIRNRANRIVGHVQARTDWLD